MSEVIEELTDAPPAPLSAADRAKIERKRQAALLLRQSRLQAHPYAVTDKGHPVKGVAKPIDTGAGFFIEPEEEKQAPKIVHPAGPVIDDDRLICEDCCKEFVESVFFDKLGEMICNTCRLNEEKYPLISKTAAREKYLLNGDDIEKREPPLKHISRKNPYNQSWSGMKLYLESHVKQRCLDVYGSLEKMEERREEREAQAKQAKQKKFDKKVKDLRLAVRSSLIKKSSEAHQHEYGTEQHDEEEDMYFKTCNSCGHTLSYEKM